jgi:hypothetical protein
MNVITQNRLQELAAFVAGLIIGAALAATVRLQREVEIAEDELERAQDEDAVDRMREAYAEWKSDRSVARPYSEIRAELLAEGWLEERSVEPSL